MIVLIGESGAGKSSIERRLCDFGFEKVVSHTTRPPRKGEVDGVDYHFVQSFADIKDDLIEHTTYRGWQYGIHKDECGLNKVVVVEMKGLSQLIDSMGRENLEVCYIHTPERERMVRMLKRGDDIDEIMRRVRADRADFANAHVFADMIVPGEMSVESCVTLIRRHLSIQGV